MAIETLIAKAETPRSSLALFELAEDINHLPSPARKFVRSQIRGASSVQRHVARSLAVRGNLLLALAAISGGLAGAALFTSDPAVITYAMQLL